MAVEFPQVRIGGTVFAGLPPALYCLAHAHDDLVERKGLHNEVVGTPLDRVDRHRYVALRRDNEDRRAVALRVEFLEDVETRAAGHVHVEQHAAGCAGAGGGEKRGAFRKFSDREALIGEYERKRIAHALVVVNDEHLSA